MAGNRMNTKTKAREDKGKVGKGVSQNTEDNEDVVDFAVLRKPVPTSVTGFAQARKIFDLATEELKDLLSNECDLLYECKVCRNIFRSLANFISHKRVYCKEKFNSSTHGHFISHNSIAVELQQIKRMEEGYQHYLKNKCSVENNAEEENNEQIPLSKDLTAVYENILKTKGINESKEDPNVVFRQIPNSSVAMFQTVSFEDKRTDNMKTEVQELDTILSRNRAVLQDDGTFIVERSEDCREADIIQISDEDDNDDGDILKCKICDLQFSTQKTLKFHMKYKHLESRLVYPCPDCLEIFSTSWSVFRHLFKVHRKTAAQVRKLRESVQAKAFRMNNPPAFYERRKKPTQPQPLTEDEKRDQENQAWLENVESLGSVPRCGGCGRTFERRAALAAHAATCQTRARALAAPATNTAATSAARTQPRPDPKKIEIQIRKDYNKEPFGVTILKPSQFLEALKTVSESKPSEECKSATQAENDVGKEEDENESSEAPMDLEDDGSDGSNDQPEPTQDHIKPAINLPFSLQAEKTNLAAFKQRIAHEIDITKLLCKKCDVKLETPIQLYEHMAEHFSWARYACKLCNFKHYKFEHLPEHVKTVHKLKGDSDFYYSTVKAIDGREAMTLSACMTEADNKEDETNDANEMNAENRRPSRCSSDSSRLSDESTSSTNVTSRKRKVFENSKGVSKKKKDSNQDGADQRDDICSNDKLPKAIGASGALNIKTFEENSSDLDDIEDRISNRHSLDGMPITTHSKRPIRKRTKVKNADFEYDLSNLLKMDASGCRETTGVVSGETKVTKTIATTSGKVTPTPTLKSSQPKKKVVNDTVNILEMYNKDCFGAMITLSKKAVENATAHMRTSKCALYSVEHRPNFARPVTSPRILFRGDVREYFKNPNDEVKQISSAKKLPVLKNVSDELKDISIPKNLPNPRNPNEEVNNMCTPRKISKVAIMPPFTDIDINNSLNSEQEMLLPKDDFKIMLKKPVLIQSENNNEKIVQYNKDKGVASETSASSTSTENIVDNGEADETPAPSKSTENIIEQNIPDDNKPEKIEKSLGISAIVPIKFNRESMEIMRNNPIINKNLAELSKAGNKTKILVIKPINRKGVIGRSINSPLKFQTIKLKDPSKVSSNENNASDQIMVVKVPEVPCSNVNENKMISVALSSNSVPNTNNHNSEEKPEGTDIENPLVENKLVNEKNEKESCENKKSENQKESGAETILTEKEIIENVNTETGNKSKT